MFAKVVIESPLPQLERVFEYKVPNALVERVKFGVRVRVQVGNAKKLHDGFIVGLAESAEYTGKLSDIEELVSNAPVLTEAIYEFLTALAVRQSTPLGELLRLAVPPRSVKVETQWLESIPHVVAHEPRRDAANKSAWLVPAVSAGDSMSWVESLAARAKHMLIDGSTIVCLPDQADVELMLAKLTEDPELSERIVNLSSAQTPAKRYAAFLRCLTGERLLVVGNRAALFAPNRDLHGILVWNENNFSHIDQSSPYLHSRDLALLRQSQSECDLVFASFGTSTEIMRLIQMGYLSLDASNQIRPKISYEQQIDRAESLALKTIKTALANGPVLVQVSALGQSVAVYCKHCSEKMHCSHCAGPLWLNGKAQPVCRWCNALNFGAKCRQCGGSEIRQGRGGSTRSVAEFGKAFPGIRVIESNSQNRIQRIDAKPVLVVATPGCEPPAENGYSAVILMDAVNQLSRDSLRSVEDAVAAWNDAVSLLSSNGQAVLVGVGGKLAEQYVLWQQLEIAADQLAERRELGLPPALRLGSITGPREVCQAVSEVAKSHGAEILGPSAIDIDTDQYLFKFHYADGIELATALKATALKMGAGMNAKTNRMQRLVRIKMDDRQVI